jgi:DNA modification methylase
VSFRADGGRDDVQKLQFDLDLLGFTADELQTFLDTDLVSGLADPDVVPAPPDQPVTRPGDLWLLGNDHRLLCGDAAKAEDVDRLLDGRVIHLAVTDPPYNVRVEPRSRNAIAAGLSSFSASPRQHGGARRSAEGEPARRQLRAKDRPLANDFIDDAEFDRLLRAWFGNIARVLLPGHSFFVWGGYSNIGNYPHALKSAGLYFSQQIIWVKEHPVMTRKDFLGNHEWCFYGWREGAGHRFFGPANATDVWSIKKIPPQNMVRYRQTRYIALPGL